METDEIFERFKKSLENMSDENFAKFLNEIESDPQEGGITVGEFLESMNFNNPTVEVLPFDEQRKVS